jgi:hypothetical protein
LTSDEIEEQAREKEEKKAQEDAQKESEKPLESISLKASDDRLMMMRKDGRTTSRTQLWWLAYNSVHQSDLPAFVSITMLESELDVFGSSHEADSVLCKRLSKIMQEIGTAMHANKPELGDIVALRDEIISVVVTVDQQLGLVIATVGWSCVWVCLAVSSSSVLASLESPDNQL